MKQSELLPLLALAEARFGASQARLAALRRQEQDLRGQLAGLSGARRDPGLGPGDTAMRAGADIRWQRWIDTRRAALNRELAQLMALRSREFLRVKADFGRREALKGIETRVREADRQLRQRRRDQIS